MAQTVAGGLRRAGPGSAEWQTVGKLTGQIIDAMQPGANTRARQAFIDDFGDTVDGFFDSLAFDTDGTRAALADIEAEFESIAEDKPSDPCDFELMDVDESMGNTRISSRFLKQIKGMQAGQWFIYDDKSESDEKLARIKLILNWSESEQLLFTNHNRRKLPQMSYAEFARYFERGTMKSLAAKAPCHALIR